MKLTRFRPRLLSELRHYSAEKFTADVGAGLTVGLVALPLAIAFGIASGVKPENGIFTAIIAGFLISALGGSRVQVGGPAGAFVVIIYGIIHQYGLANLFIATMMAGVLLLAMGLTGMGSLIRFIPVAVVIGFTSGIAVLIALSQVRDVLGLRIENMPADFFSQVSVLAKNIHTLDAASLTLASASLLIIVAWPRIAALSGRAGMFNLPGGSALVGPDSRHHRRAGSRYDGGCTVRSAGGNNRQPLRWHPAVVSGPRFAGVPLVHGPAAGGSNDHHRPAVRHRIPALRAGG